MSEFGKPVVPAQSVDRRLTDSQFDQNIIYNDDFIQVEETIPFSQGVTLEGDRLLMESPSFNNPIISKAHNYTQDYFELRAQPGLVIGGGGSAVPVSTYDYSMYAPHPGIIAFTRDGDGKVISIQNINSIGTKTTNFTRVDGVVTEIDINTYGTLRNIAFTRELGVVTQITTT